MRDGWTEADVLGLASEEPDKFDRKSGSLLAGDKNAFYDALAKAASAFSNSGGGSLVLGAEDDGSFSGLDPLVGRTSMKDWIEQKLPDLLAYPLTLFRVHTVVPDTPSIIPNGKILVVVEFGDSPAAPHQSARDKKYYHRAGGRSEPAQHFYLELLRQRFTNPSLDFESESMAPTHAGVLVGKLYLETKLRIRVKNTENVAAYKWALVPRTTENELVSEAAMKASIFPFFSDFPIQRSRSPGIRLDDTILPGCSLIHEIDMGFLLTDAKASGGEIREAIKRIVCSSTLGLQLATEMSPGEIKNVPLSDVCNVDGTMQFILDANLAT